MYNTNNTKARQERSEHMVIELDMESEVPIYVQLRNQIVKGIGKGELKAQEKLPTVRQLAAEAGVNTMTVNKAYQILKAEGYIKIDRRHGAVVADVVDMDLQFREKLEAELDMRRLKRRQRSGEPRRSQWPTTAMTAARPSCSICSGAVESGDWPAFCL
jgi:DNA-binding transcriptional regulator YhcF (GntR family)